MNIVTHEETDTTEILAINTDFSINDSVIIPINKYRIRDCEITA